MTIEQLKLFLQVTELGSFKKVAEQNYISQRAVSQQIKKLETELACQLFIRGYNNLTLTVAGDFFKQRCVTIINLIDDTSHKLRNITSSTNSLLSIGYFSPFDTFLIRPLLSSLSSSIQTDIIEEAPEHLISDILLNKLDCAILMDNYGSTVNFKQLGLKSITIYHDQMVIGVAKKLLPKLDHPLHLSSFKNLPVIYYNNEESSFLKTSFLASTDPGLNFSHVTRTSSYEQMQLLVSLGKAISFYPRSLISLLSNPSEGIQYIFPDEYEGKYFQFKLVYKKKVNPALQELIKVATTKKIIPNKK